MGVKNDLIDIMDEKTNGIIYETFDTPASLCFAKFRLSDYAMLLGVYDGI